MTSPSELWLFLPAHHEYADSDCIVRVVTAETIQRLQTMMDTALGLHVGVSDLAHIALYDCSWQWVDSFNMLANIETKDLEGIASRKSMFVNNDGSSLGAITEGDGFQEPFLTLPFMDIPEDTQRMGGEYAYVDSRNIHWGGRPKHSDFEIISGEINRGHLKEMGQLLEQSPNEWDFDPNDEGQVLEFCSRVSGSLSEEEERMLLCLLKDDASRTLLSDTLYK